MQGEAYDQTIEHDLRGGDVVALVYQLFNKMTLALDERITFGDLLLCLKQFNHTIKTLKAVAFGDVATFLQIKLSVEFFASILVEDLTK